jgi:hypothetical protein
VAALYERRGSIKWLGNDGGRRLPLQPETTLAEVSISDQKTGVLVGVGNEKCENGDRRMVHLSGGDGLAGIFINPHGYFVMN